MGFLFRLRAAASPSAKGERKENEHGRSRVTQTVEKSGEMFFRYYEMDHRYDRLQNQRTVDLEDVLAIFALRLVIKRRREMFLWFEKQ